MFYGAPLVTLDEKILKMSGHALLHCAHALLFCGHEIVNACPRHNNIWPRYSQLSLGHMFTIVWSQQLSHGHAFIILRPYLIISLFFFYVSDSQIFNLKRKETEGEMRLTDTRFCPLNEHQSNIQSADIFYSCFFFCPKHHIMRVNKGSASEI